METNFSIEQIKAKCWEMNICTNTVTGHVFVGGLKKKNILYSDDGNYYLITGYEKFMGIKHAKKLFFKDKLEIAAINYHLSN